MTIHEALVKANKHLMKKVDDAMSKEVFKEVQDEESATIYSEVYKVYSPRMYRRRGEYGGLGDPYNIEMCGGSARDGKMVVVNMTDPNPDGCVNDSMVTTGKNLPELVEYGDGYKFYRYDFPKRGAAFMGPRPFTAKTVENLKKSMAHIGALKNGLKRQGIKVK